MCFYDYYTFQCGDWKFGNFRQHCQKEYRIGETCGMKMFYNKHDKKEDCSLCTRLNTKKRKYERAQQKVKRWKAENRCPSQMADAMKEMDDLALIINEITEKRAKLLNAVGTRG